MSFSKLSLWVPFCCAIKLNVAVLSIMPRLTIWASFGSFTQKRTLPVVEIVPLKVVPWGSTYRSCFDEKFRVNVGSVVANTEIDVTDINSRTASAAVGSILVFFIDHSTVDI